MVKKQKATIKFEEQIAKKAPANTIAPKIDKNLQLERKLQQLQEGYEGEQVLIKCKSDVKLDSNGFNDDIKREQEFYRLITENLDQVQKKVGRSQDFLQGLLKPVVKGEIIQNTLVKQQARVKNEDEKLLKDQGKKILSIVKNQDVEKREKLIKQIEKNLKSKKNEEEEKEYTPKQTMIKKIFKKGIKQKKTKRPGKQTRIRAKNKQASRRNN